VTAGASCTTLRAMDEQAIRRATLITLRRALYERIQLAESGGTAWTRRGSSGKIRRVPLDLTDLELETAARACRALAYHEEQAAKRMENPGMRGPIENTARRASALAGKFEAARKRA
jgi:hypothetical protein